ncbi:deleted in malignant brain tumors 1 protein-like [Penaeus japonicus]|uniref:deleted in malignant brain tumors 1 protein-like n=1 Tax=Penaeus japonicus TaxID=27405 RepID=UPI001C7153E2|nr:deleted in malignant brain tumors 1 protein-like [Penaeus japonicus]
MSPEISHAMGFYHGNSPDPTATPMFISTRRTSGTSEKGNFAKQTDSRVDNKKAYDYTSDMHYSGFFYQCNNTSTPVHKGSFIYVAVHSSGFSGGRLTIITVDPRNQELIGRRAGLSHRDKHLANLMYGCIGQCPFFGFHCAASLIYYISDQDADLLHDYTVQRISSFMMLLSTVTAGPTCLGTTFTSSSNELILMFYTKIQWQDLANTSTFGSTTQTPTTEATTTPPSSPSCSLVSATEGVSWFSPNFGSENYPNNFQCGLKGSSASPYTSTFALNTFQLQGKKQGKCVDFVGIQIPYNRTVKLCGNRKGSIVVPNMNLNVNFVTDAWKTNVGFDIGITWRQTNCHRVIELTDDNASGIIRSPRYPKKYPRDAVCEWWIVAPEGKKIQLEFTTINMRDRKCTNSYIAVDKSGSAKYFPENSSLFCAADRSASVTSDGNRVNVAFAGGRKRSKGFSARYTLV